MFRRRPYRRMFRRRFYRRGGSRTSLIKRTLRNIAESKFAFVSYQDVVTTNGWTSSADNSLFRINDLSPSIPTGVTKNSRIGNNIQYNWLTLRLNMSCLSNGTASIPPEGAFFVRVIFFQKRVPISTPSDILPMSTTVDYATWAQPALATYPVWNQNIRVLNDEIFPMYANTALPGGVNQYFSGSDGGATVTCRHRVNNKVNFRSTQSFIPEDPTDQYGVLIFVRGNRTPTQNSTAGFNVYYNLTLKISYVDA